MKRERERESKGMEQRERERERTTRVGLHKVSRGRDELAERTVEHFRRTGERKNEV